MRLVDVSAVLHRTRCAALICDVVPMISHLFSHQQLHRRIVHRDASGLFLSEVCL